MRACVCVCVHSLNDLKQYLARDLYHIQVYLISKLKTTMPCTSVAVL